MIKFDVLNRSGRVQFTGLHWVGVLWIASVTFAYGVSLLVRMAI